MVVSKPNLVVTLDQSDKKKHSTKFFTVADASFDNLYVKQDAIPANCKGIVVTVEFLT